MFYLKRQSCVIYIHARNTQSKLSEALIKQLPDAYEHKTQIAELMKTYEQRKESVIFDYDDILSIVAVHLQTQKRSPIGLQVLSGITS